MSRDIRLVVVQQYLAPYRLPLFEALSRRLGDENFCVVTTRDNHDKHRQWSVSYESLGFVHERVAAIRMSTKKIVLDVPLRSPHVLSTMRPTHLITNGWESILSFMCARLASRLDSALVPWIESSQVTVRKHGPIASSSRRFILSRAAAFATPGALATLYVSSLGYHQPVVNLPNSISRQLLQEPVGTRSKGAVFIGELSDRKGFDLILDASDALIDRFGSVTVIGAGPLENHPSVRSFRMLGQVHDYAQIASELDSARVLLLPSRRDPWPLVAAEALTRSLPMVLGPGVGSAPDLAALAPGRIFQMQQPSVAELMRASQEALALDETPRKVEYYFDADRVAASLVDQLMAVRAGGAR
jgi:glycosyltransferase involved in cell wall biosynthesis